MESDEMEFIGTEDYNKDIPVDPAPKVNVPQSGKVFSLFVGFKVVPFFIYLFGWIFCPWTIFQWVLTIVSAAADFWFTKNVAGRLILGMRWSNSVNEDGESKWLFEYANVEISDKNGQRKTFWILLYSATLIWAIFGFFSLIKFNFGWFFVVVITFSLSLSNAWGFMKCDRSIKGDIEKGAANFFRDQFLPYLAGKAQTSFSQNNENENIV